jgi:hypothetical protein
MHLHTWVLLTPVHPLPCDAGASGQTVVQEFTLGQQDAKGVWSLTLDNITIGEKKVRRMHASQLLVHLCQVLR